jgi:hypothetical protein
VGHPHQPDSQENSSSYHKWRCSTRDQPTEWSSRTTALIYCARLDGQYAALRRRRARTVRNRGTYRQRWHGRGLPRSAIPTHLAWPYRNITGYLRRPTDRSSGWHLQHPGPWLSSLFNGVFRDLSRAWARGPPSEFTVILRPGQTRPLRFPRNIPTRAIHIVLGFRDFEPAVICCRACSLCVSAGVLKCSSVLCAITSSARAMRRREASMRANDF